MKKTHNKLARIEMPAVTDRHRHEIERLHKGIVVELDRHFTGSGERKEAARPQGTMIHAVEDDVASTITVIRQVALVIDEMQETIRQQEDLIDQQRRELSHLKAQGQEATITLAEVKRTASAERARADSAEKQSQSDALQIKRQEDHIAKLKSQLTMLITVARENLPTGKTAIAACDPASALHSSAMLVGRSLLE